MLYADVPSTPFRREREVRPSLQAGEYACTPTSIPYLPPVVLPAVPSVGPLGKRKRSPRWRGTFGEGRQGVKRREEGDRIYDRIHPSHLSSGTGPTVAPVPVSRRWKVFRDKVARDRRGVSRSVPAVGARLTCRDLGLCPRLVEGPGRSEKVLGRQDWGGTGYVLWVHGQGPFRRRRFVVPRSEG